MEEPVLRTRRFGFLPRTPLKYFKLTLWVILHWLIVIGNFAAFFILAYQGFHPDQRRRHLDPHPAPGRGRRSPLGPDDGDQRQRSFPLLQVRHPGDDRQRRRVYREYLFDVGCSRRRLFSALCRGQGRSDPPNYGCRQPVHRTRSAH